MHHAPRRPAAVLSLLLAAVALPAQSGWVQWTAGNGNWYLAVKAPGGIDWATARARAQQLGGDLATIASAAENSFVYGLVNDAALWRLVPNPNRMFGPWLGGSQPPGTAVPSAGWQWVTGETWAYTRWAPGEPNDYQGLVEDRLHFFAGGTSRGSTWNDLRGANLLPGFVVESASAPVAAWIPLGAGCAATAGGPVPTLAPVGNDVPRLGSTFRLEVTGYAAGSSLVAVAAGLQNRRAVLSAGTLALPIDLTPVGFPGCSQQIAADAAVFQPATSTSVVLAFPVPNDPSLRGQPLFFQAGVLAGSTLALTASVLASLGP